MWSNTLRSCGENPLLAHTRIVYLRRCLHGFDEIAENGDVTADLNRAGFPASASSSRCQATSNTILPRACPVSLSSWARRASDSGSTVSTVGLIFPESTSVASSANSVSIVGPPSEDEAENHGVRSAYLSAQGGSSL